VPQSEDGRSLNPAKLPAVALGLRMIPSLFNDDDHSQARRLGPTLRSLAAEGVYLGTSSWKYEGWLGTIYDRDRYVSRGRFSKKKFEADCIREYAETFPTVGADFSFYQFPAPDFWSHLFTGLPEDFSFGMKVPEEITVLRWPSHARYGPRAGTTNQHFLDTSLFERAFSGVLTPHRRHVAVMMFEFGAFSRDEFPDVAAFLERLDGFLGALPAGWPYAVEIRNEEFLGPEYFGVLARHNVAHVFNAWTRMPTLAEQIAMPGSFTADFTVVRALLRRGRGFEKAVKMFAPYGEVKEPQEETRQALREIVRHTLRTRRRAYAYVNNRLEGNAPTTIEAVASAEE